MPEQPPPAETAELLRDLLRRYGHHFNVGHQMQVAEHIERLETEPSTSRSS